QVRVRVPGGRPLGPRPGRRPGSTTADGRYVVQYEGPPRTEPGVQKARLVPLPEVPRDTTLLAQACRLDDQGARVDVARRSPPCWPQHGLTVGTLPACAATAATMATGVLPAQPQTGCYLQLGTAAVLPAAAAAPAAGRKLAGDAVQPVVPAPLTVQPVMPALFSVNLQPMMSAPVRWIGPHAVVRGQ
ncbi:unnamed protein product, partial [Prorocentrum cordatum]